MKAMGTSIDLFKITPPLLTGTVPRRALIGQIGAIFTPGKWLCAPSGSGKSTLIAAYIQQSKRPVVWYRLDARDDDPAFFFATFAQALCAQQKGMANLPHFSDADHGNETAFAGRFFAAVLARIRAPSLFVLDDFQQTSAEWLAPALVQLLQRPVPEREVVFISEAPPPPPFFDSVVARHLSLANDLEFRFSASECDAIAQLLRLSGMRGEDILALTGGHAGAVVLACEFMRGTRPASAPAEALTRKMHAHLLGKLVDQLPAELRDLLLRTSSLPRLTVALVNELLGQTESGGLLEALAERGLVMRFARDGDIAYEAHGLVRAGARALARDVFGEHEAGMQGDRCAQLLQVSGLLEDAFELWVELDAFDSALDVLDRLAPRFASRRQPRLLLRAVDRVPAELIQSRPWILFWAGHALLGVDERKSCEWLGRAFQAFEAQGVDNGMLLCASAALAALNSDPFDSAALGHWLVRLAANRSAAVNLPDKRLRAIYLLGLVCEGNLGAHDEAARAENEEAFSELIALATDQEAWSSSDQMLAVARTLIEHAHVFYSFPLAQQIVVQTQPLANDEANSPLLRGRWWLAVAEMQSILGEHERFAASMAQVDKLLAISDTNALRFLMLRIRIDYSLRRDDLDTVKSLMPDFEDVCAGGTPRELAQFGVIATRVLLRQQRFSEALAQAEAAASTAAKSGFVGAEARILEVTLANTLAANQRFRDAADRLHRLAEDQGKAQGSYFRSMALCLDFCDSAGKNLVALRRGLDLARELSFINILQRTPDLLSQIFVTALANDIEPEFVRRVITHQRLKPPVEAGSEWPWPVRVWTLGGFRLEINGEQYRPAHKSQDKPLELLKLLVAAQALGRDWPDKGWLAEQLWPDADEANARKSLDMTVGRLRRVLGSDQSVEAAEGKLRVNRLIVWSDLQFMLRASSEVLNRHSTAAKQRPVVDGEAGAAVDRVLRAYGGQFLLGEDETPWVLGARTTVSRTFCSAIAAAGGSNSAVDDQRGLLALERALLVEPAAEDLARALMQRYLAAGRHAEALRVYRRCKEMLSVILGVAPSAQTEALRARIYLTADSDAAAGHPSPPELR